MIPLKLEDWTLDTLEQLIDKGYFETDQFDLKETLPHPSDQKSKTRLSKSCCAFSNSSGGFLIFGIKDDKGLSKNERLIGLDSKIDFPEHFGNYPRKASGTIDWDFFNPGIKLENGNVIHIVRIHPSRFGPQALEIDENLVFYKRTNKGNEPMSYIEIKNDFLNVYEKRLKLNLLETELVEIIEKANGMIIQPEMISSTHTLLSFDLSILNSVLLDTYTVLIEEPTLVDYLKKLKSECDIIQTKTKIFWGAVNLPMSNKAETVKSHNEYVNSRIPTVILIAQECQKLLGKIKLKL